MEKSYPKIGVNVFVLKDGKILLGKRIGKTGYGTWCLPGGHFEWGESLIEAAKRELKEETGIISDSLEYLQLINDPQDSTHYVHINFLAKDYIGEPKVTEPNKFQEWNWFDLNTLPDQIFSGHQKFIPAFLKHIGFIDNR
jgi:8-oxo-dGTP diphosphatase